MKSPSCLFGWAFCLALKQILCTFFSRIASSDELKFKCDWLGERQHMLSCLLFILLTKTKPFAHCKRAFNPSFETVSHSLLSLPFLFLFFFLSLSLLFCLHLQWHLAILPKMERTKGEYSKHTITILFIETSILFVLRKFIKKPFGFSWWFSLKERTSSHPRERGENPAI